MCNFWYFIYVTVKENLKVEMTQKGYLKKGDGVTALCGDTTTVGRENCDIIINVSYVLQFKNVRQ